LLHPCFCEACCRQCRSKWRCRCRKQRSRRHQYHGWYVEQRRKRYICVYQHLIICFIITTITFTHQEGTKISTNTSCLCLHNHIYTSQRLAFRPPSHLQHASSSNHGPWWLQSHLISRSRPRRLQPRCQDQRHQQTQQPLQLDRPLCSCRRRWQRWLQLEYPTSTITPSSRLQLEAGHFDEKQHCIIYGV
jgi:hypothetical protein